MNTPTSHRHISAHSRALVGGRRPPHSRHPAAAPLHNKETHLHSDCPPEPEPQESPGLGQRSVSLTTLQPAVIEPRMAQLETLEAKMASIEVSLSSTPRRKIKNGSLSGVSLNSSIRNASIPKEIALKELESLRLALKDKENIIQSLKGQLTIPGLRLSSIRNHNNNNVNNNNNNNINNANNRELTEVEKKQAEERLNRLRIDVDNKRLAIKNLKMALERLDITDNIDVRIQQAELEYQLGREELNLLTLLEETRALQLCLEESNRHSTQSHTLYSCVNGSERVILLAIDVDYDPKSPKFGAGPRDSTPGLWIDWALDETGMCKEDRLIEVNGKIVLTKNRDDLSRLLAAAPDPAQIVVLRKIPAEIKTNINHSPRLVNDNAGKGKEVTFLRSELEVLREKAEEAQKTKDGLISDNIRLTHRISYLEEQVSELLCRNTKPDSTAGTSSAIPSSGSSNDAQCLPSTTVAKNPPSSVTLVKTNQNVTNINITSTTATPTNRSQTSSTNNDLSLTTNPLQTTKEGVQVFQKGSQVTALVANLPGLDTTKESHTLLPVRSKSSMSNVSNTHIPATQPNSNSHNNNSNNNNNKDRSADDSKYHNCHNSNVKSNGSRHPSKHRSSSSRSRHHHGSTSLVNSQNNLDQSQEQLANGDVGSNDKVTYRKHHHHHHREKDYTSETNSTAEQITRYNKRNMENSHRHSMQEFNNYPSNRANSVNSEKDYATSDNLMDQSFKKATKIVHELTRNQNKDTVVTNNTSSLYEKHRQKCITASEKSYNSDLLKHYNARKSTSVLDFRSEIHIGPNKYGVDSKSAEELDILENNCTPSGDNRRLMSYTGSRRVQDCRSVKSLDFDSDCASSTTTTSRITKNGCESSKNLDYTSEPILENYSTGRKLYYYGHSSHFNNADNSGSMRPRPTPPKKPLRLSLHKTQSLQSVETPTPSSSGTPSGSPKNSASAKNYEGSSTRKRTYKGEATSAAMFGSKNSSGVEMAGFAGGNNRTSETTASAMKWTNHFAHHKKESSAVENGSWC